MGFKSNSMKRLIPFIPIIGIFLILFDKTVMSVHRHNPIIFHLSAMFQAFCFFILLILIGLI